MKCPSVLADQPSRRLCALAAVLPLTGLGLSTATDVRTPGELIDVFADRPALASPESPILGPDGLLYVTSYHTNSILRFDARTGELIDVFATVEPPYNLLQLEFGPDGDLYATSYNTPGAVLRFEAGTGAFGGVFATCPELVRPTALDFGPGGDLFVVTQSASQDAVHRFDGETGAYLGAFTPAGALTSSYAMEFGPDGHLYVADNSGGVAGVYRFDGRTGAPLGLFTGGYPLTGAYALEFGPDGSIYVADLWSGQVLRYDRGGAFDRILVDDGVLGPTGMCFDARGRLLVTDRATADVLEYDSADGAFLRVLVDQPGLYKPSGLVFGPESNLYVGSTYDAVVRFDGRTGAFLDQFVDGFGYETVMTFGPDGNLYASDAPLPFVRRYDGITGDPIDEFWTDSYGPVHGLVFEPGGNLYVADEYFVHEVDAATGATVRRVTSSSDLAQAWDLAFGPDGNLFVSDRGADRVVRFDLATGALLDVVAEGPELDSPTGLAFGQDCRLYVCSEGTDQVLSYGWLNPSDVVVAAEGGGLDRPRDVVFGPDGNLYVSSADTNQVLRYRGPRGPAEMLGELAGEVDRLVVAGVLTAGQGSLLATELAAADASLGAPAVATSHLAEFARLVSTLVEASLLRPALGSELIADAVAIANRVDRYGRCDPPPPSLPPPG